MMVLVTTTGLMTNAVFLITPIVQSFVEVTGAGVMVEVGFFVFAGCVTLIVRVELVAVVEMSVLVESGVDVITAVIVGV